MPKPHIRLNSAETHPMVVANSGGYDAADSTLPAMRHFLPSPHSADDAVLPGHEDMVARAQDLERNNGAMASAVRTMCDHTVSHILISQPAPDAQMLGWSDDQAGSWSVLDIAPTKYGAVISDRD